MQEDGAVTVAEGSAPCQLTACCMQGDGAVTVELAQPPVNSHSAVNKGAGLSV